MHFHAPGARPFGMPKPKIPDDLAKMAGLRLRAAREAMEWPQGAFATRIGVNQNTLGNWEGGRHTMPAIEAMVKAHMLCGVPLDWVYCGSVHNLPHGLAATIEAKAAELGAVIGGPVAEWPHAVEREAQFHGMRKPAAAPDPTPSRGKLHERQQELQPHPSDSPRSDARTTRRAAS